MRAAHTAKCDVFPSVVSLSRNLINIILRNYVSAERNDSGKAHTSTRGLRWCVCSLLSESVEVRLKDKSRRFWIVLQSASMENQNFIEVSVLIQETDLEDLKSFVLAKGGRVTVQTAETGRYRRYNSLNNSKSDWDFLRYSGFSASFHAEDFCDTFLSEPLNFSQEIFQFAWRKAVMRMSIAPR